MSRKDTIWIDFNKKVKFSFYLHFFLLALGRSLAHGFQPNGSAGLTLEVKGLLPLLSAFL